MTSFCVVQTQYANGLVVKGKPMDCNQARSFEETTPDYTTRAIPVGDNEAQAAHVRLKPPFPPANGLEKALSELGNK